MSTSSTEADSTSTTSSDDVLDLICIGFGPAGLTIAVALEDRLEENAISGQEHFNTTNRPRTLFLEKQTSFNWHAGMLLHSAKMQISFIKDLATVRDPSSRFTFLNYLKAHGRLKEFSRFNTFLPTRLEFSDYLRWAAGHFSSYVKYGHEVVQVQPIRKGSKVAHFRVNARDCSSGKIVKAYAKRIVIAAGGSPSRPLSFQNQHPSILHSSQYETAIDSLLPDRSISYRVAVIGSGQSAAEVFDDLATRLPNAYTTIIFRDTALRPSDDSPFVNEVFNPTAIDTFFKKTSNQRLIDIKRDKATNYSVVRLELIEKIYADLYLQDIQQPDPLQQQRRMLSSTDIVRVQTKKNDNTHFDGAGSVYLTLKDRTNDITTDANSTRTLEFDAVILATGYTRNAYLEILRECRDLSAVPGLAESGLEQVAQTSWFVQRDYSLNLKSDLVSDDVGIWLQGCNEATHGLSDSLLSVLATRSGELVQSLFGETREKAGPSVDKSRSRNRTLSARL